MVLGRKWWSILRFGKPAEKVGKEAGEEAKVREAVFSETSEWKVSETERTPTVLEVALQEQMQEKEPKEEGVRKLLSSERSMRECWTLPEHSVTLGKGASQVKLIVGLGNPGAQYIGTRHNIGYEVLAELGKRYGIGRPKSKFQGELLESSISGQKVLLLSPVTYMNRSGSSVRPCIDFYRIAVENVLILCDDVSLPVGKLRMRAQGSSGGQKGLGDVIRVLGTDKVSRLRVGVGEKPPGWDLADYVLSKFSKEDRLVMAEAVNQASDAVVLWVTSGIERSMDRYN